VLAFPENAFRKDTPIRKDNPRPFGLVGRKWIYQRRKKSWSPGHVHSSFGEDYPGENCRTTPAKIAGGTPADFSKTAAKIAGVVIMSPHQSPEQRGVNTQTAPSKPEPQKRPERPTVEQWVEYAKAKYPWWPSEDAENSWHHYNGNGWRTKTGPVKVWQSTVATCHGFFRKDHPTAEKEWKRRIPVDAPIRNSNGQKPLTRDQYLAMNKGESLEL
jgi:hypothetical protein